MSPTAVPGKWGLACPVFMARADGWSVEGVSKRCNHGFENMSKVHEHLKNVHFRTPKNPHGHFHDEQMQSDVKYWFERQHKSMEKEVKWLKVYKVLFPFALEPGTTYYETIIDVNDKYRHMNFDFQDNQVD